MIIDIRKDVPDFLDYIHGRVAEHVVAAKTVRKPKLVTQIDFGIRVWPGKRIVARV